MDKNNITSSSTTWSSPLLNQKIRPQPTVNMDDYEYESYNDHIKKVFGSNCGPSSYNDMIRRYFNAQQLPDFAYIFLNPSNFDKVNNRLIDLMKELSKKKYGKEYTISSQRHDELLAVMSSIFLDYYSPNAERYTIDNEIKRLNEMTVYKIIPHIFNNFVANVNYAKKLRRNEMFFNDIDTIDFSSTPSYMYGVACRNVIDQQVIQMNENTRSEKPEISQEWYDFF